MKWIEVSLVIVFSFGALRVRAQAPGAPPPGLGYPPDTVWPNPRPPVRPLTPSQREDENLSERTKLSVKDVRKLKAAAGIADVDWTNGTVLVDSRTLGHHQILLSIFSQKALCLTAEVFSHSGGNFQEVWSLNAIPGGAALCQLPGCTVPQAQATKSGDVEITVPAHRDGADYDVCDDEDVLTFHEVGATFQLEKEAKVPALAPCHLDSEVFAAATHETSESDRLALIEVMWLPSAQVSAIVFAKTHDGPVVTAYGGKPPPYVEDRYRKAMVTPSECIEASKSAPIDRIRLPLSADEAQAILDKLPKLSQSTSASNCTAGARSGCAYIMDGVMVLVFFPNGSTLSLRKSPLAPGLKGPAATAEDWVQQLHILVGDPPAQ